MKMEMTFDDLYNVYGACNATAQKMVENKQKGNGKFLNFLFNNRDKSRKILVEFEKERPMPNDNLKKFIDLERVLLNPDPIPEETPEAKELREAETKVKHEAIKLEYKEELDNWEKQRDEFNSKLSTSVGFEPVMLKEENLPSEIDADAMEVFYKLVINK